MKVALFFGSFNPIHIGHISIIENTMNLEFIDEVWIIPSPKSPYKENTIDINHRFNMIEDVIKDYSNVKLSKIEEHISPNYTYITMDILVKKYPDYDFFIVLGGDNTETFMKWENYESILSKFNLIVFNRQGYKNIPNIKLVIDNDINLSSTYIRNNINDIDSIKNILHESTLSYIINNNLYNNENGDD